VQFTENVPDFTVLFAKRKVLIYTLCVKLCEGSDGMDLERINEMPFIKLCGAKAVKADSDGAEMECIIEDKHTNAYGFAHGGMIFTLLDTVAAMAARQGEMGVNLVTQCGDVHFLRPLCKGKAVARSKLVKSGHTTALAEAQVFDCTGRLCAHGMFELFYIN